jgi:S-adenosylmethionine decarboxylase
MLYKPGLHILAKLGKCNNQKIKSALQIKPIIDTFIANNQLCNLGEVYHQFSEAGFTAIICLSESHLSIHTWPEHDIVNFDIYLSNQEKVNNNTAKSFFETIVSYFEATVINSQFIER